MIVNRVKVGRAVTFMKYLVINELTKSISKKINININKYKQIINIYKLSSDDKILSSLIKKACCTSSFLNYSKEANDQ